MAKAILHPLIELVTGKMGKLVFRRAHTGKLSLVRSPDMSRVKWSAAQKEHRLRFKEAVAYARAAIADPAIRLIYEQMAAGKETEQASVRHGRLGLFPGQ